MRPAVLRRYGILGLTLISLALAAAMFGPPAPAAAPPGQPIAPPPSATPASQASVAPAARPVATLGATRATAPIPSPAAARAAPTAPSATGPHLRVGIQAGHWRASELPAELTHLHISSGTSAAGYSEAEVTLDIARRAAALLASIGVDVDVLPATVPPGYSADAFVALHADGFAQAGARGFSVATAWAASRASEHLRETLDAEYARAVGLPRHGAPTVDMRGYYAFNYRRYAHAVARTTPAAIVELGFLTNPDDRALLVSAPDAIAIGIANGIVRYFNERDPNNQAALLPPDLGVWHGASASAGLDVRAAPRDDMQPLLHIEADRPVIAFEERDGWLRVIVAGAWDVVGWVRRDAIVRIAGS